MAYSLPMVRMIYGWTALPASLRMIPRSPRPDNYRRSQSLTAADRREQFFLAHTQPLYPRVAENSSI